MRIKLVNYWEKCTEMHSQQNVKNCGNICIVGQATDDNIIWHMRNTRCITKATYTHSKYVKIIAFHGNNGYTSFLDC